jgi:hypothetical protein
LKRKGKKEGRFLITLLAQRKHPSKAYRTKKAKKQIILLQRSMQSPKKHAVFQRCMQTDNPPSTGPKPPN